MLLILPLTIIALLISDASATPTPQSQGISINLRRRVHSRSVDDWGVWAKNHREGLMAKYGGRTGASKRSSGTNLYVPPSINLTKIVLILFLAPSQLERPPVSYDVILDTGSSDLWVAGNTCTSGCSSVPTFDSSASSSFADKGTAFNIVYGHGEAGGTLASETVQMAGFSVSNQVFAVCDQVSSDLLTSPVSGLLGLAWQSIAASGATPFAQTLASGTSWDSPVMAFQLTRFLNQSKTQELQAGGSFTMGFVNTTLYTGDIDFIDMPATNSYWLLPITGLHTVIYYEYGLSLFKAITVQGNSVTVPSGPSSYAAIDTGTTLVAGPPDQIASIYAQIPDSQPGTGNLEGFYLYPCATSVTVTFSFGGKTWAVSPADFQSREVSPGTCLGAFFTLTTSEGTPAWILGDTFLKNVYSVFRFNPPSVGFAQLSDYSLSMNGNVELEAPSATIGSVSVFATAGSVHANSNSAVSLRMPSLLFTIVMTIWAGLAI
ncbi:Aspartic peptidase A1 [Mycena venus]|uniref:Aspartic peptidase A1 n=1 Tax=Mycena venus TaxID=2733690 RepID=A0A8H7CIR6_9AGAR|nr:Aspartic peptidase A1 [Mycena venus]